MLQFPYLEEHSLPVQLRTRSSPPQFPASDLLFRFTIAGPSRRWYVARSVLDTGSDDTIFPLDVMHLIAQSLCQTGATASPGTGSGSQFTMLMSASFWLTIQARTRGPQP